MNRTEFYDCARALFGVEPEYPWPDEPGYAVLRHPDNRKWFAVVMDVPRINWAFPARTRSPSSTSRATRS